MSEHDLKCWPEPFRAMIAETKTFEFRRDDRGFAVGDILILHEYDPAIRETTGRVLRCTVTYLLRGPAFGVPDGFVCMSVGPTVAKWVGASTLTFLFVEPLGHCAGPHCSDDGCHCRCDACRRTKAADR